MPTVWTGKETKALRQALRLSQREFATYLEITWRTVAKWETRGVTIKPLPENQSLLDTALSRASEAVHATFNALLGEKADPSPTTAQPTSDSPSPARVSLPLVVDGRPVLVPLADDWAVSVVREGDRSTSGSGSGDGMRWDAMTPLNRRELLQQVTFAMAGSSFATDRYARGCVPGTGPTSTAKDLAVAPWARPIHDAVLHPESLSPNVSAPEGDHHDGALRAAIDRTVAAELASDFSSLARSLPSLIRTLSSNERSAVHGNSMRLLSDVYTVAGWTLIKADSPSVAETAAQKAITAARSIDDSLRVAAATRCLSEVHMRAGRFDEATRTALLAALGLDTAMGEPTSLVTLRGAALLSAAAAAARGGDPAAAYTALRAANACAADLNTDQCGHVRGTVFGPTNVAIHEVAVAIELGDARRALRHVSTVELAHLPPELTERRSRFLIDVARSHAGVGDDTAAIAALQHAERIAPHETREHRLTRALVADLLTRESRSSDLRSLAQRCHALN